MCPMCPDLFNKACNQYYVKNNLSRRHPSRHLGNVRLDPVTIAAGLKLLEGSANKPCLHELYGDVGYAFHTYFTGTQGV